MSLEREDLRELTVLSERLLDELGQLRAESERQTALLERMLASLTSLERSQYS